MLPPPLHCVTSTLNDLAQIKPKRRGRPPGAKNIVHAPAAAPAVENPENPDTPTAIMTPQGTPVYPPPTHTITLLLTDHGIYRSLSLTPRPLVQSA